MFEVTPDGSAGFVKNRKKFQEKPKLMIDNSSKSLYNIVVGVVSMELTRSELEIMDVLWGTGEPMSRSDLLSHSEEKTWKDSSVHILLNGLLAKNAIREDGVVKRSKTYGRTFVPTLTREEYFAGTVFGHRHDPDVVGLFAALLARPEVTDEAVEQIVTLIENRKA